MIETDPIQIEQIIRPICKKSTIDWIKEAPSHVRRLKFYYGRVELIYNSEGFVLYAIGNSHAFMHLIYIKEESRRRRIGTNLFKQLLYQLKLYNIPILRFKVEKNNISAIRFYQKMGYDGIYTDNSVKYEIPISNKLSEVFG
jgi:ribosomal protein S18 acetylase RimI-like enzyme